MPIDTNKLKQLREATGAGMTECKDALENASGDLDKARDILRKKNLDRAGKLVDKEAKFGRVFSYIHSTDSQKGKIGVLLELTCQTDFVAKNPEFEELLHDLALQITSMNPRWVSKEDVPASDVEAEKARFADDVKGKPPQIVEKIVLGKLDKNFFQRHCLLSMPFVNESKFKGVVEEMIKGKSGKFGEKIEVRRFVRFEVGRETSFADRTQKKA
jgi:elongation factor Ts